MSEPLLSIDEAAALLGYTVRGLRKIVTRSRARRLGADTRGPTIKFFQTSPNAPIKFRREWIEEFIQACTCDPDEGVVQVKTRKSRKAEAVTTKPSQAVRERLGFSDRFLNL